MTNTTILIQENMNFEKKQFEEEVHQKRKEKKGGTNKKDNRLTSEYSEVA